MTRSVETSSVPANARMPTKHGEFRIRAFHDEKTGLDNVALTLGNIQVGMSWVHSILVIVCRGFCENFAFLYQFFSFLHKCFSCFYTNDFAFC